MVLQPFVNLVVLRRRETGEKRMFLLYSFPTLLHARVPIVACGETKLADANPCNRGLLLKGEVRPLPPPRNLSVSCFRRIWAAL